MVSLNLLPTDDKKKLDKHYLLLIIKDVVFYCLTFLCLVGILLSLAYFILIQNFIETSQTNANIAGTDAQLTGRIRNVNNDLNSIDLIQKSFINQVDLINKINQYIPQPYIQIVNMEISGGHENKIILRGKALNRNEFLNFKSNLEKSEFFSDIESPLSNLLSDKNINFELKMNFDKEKF